MAEVKDGWLKAVEALSLSADPSGYYHSFNRPTLLATFAGMIIDQFSRPPYKDAHPERARTFWEMMEYFLQERNAPENHNNRVAAAKKYLNEIRYHYEQWEKISADSSLENYQKILPMMGLI